MRICEPGVGRVRYTFAQLRQLDENNVSRRADRRSSPDETAPIVRDRRVLYPLRPGVYRLGPFDPHARITTYVFDSAEMQEAVGAEVERPSDAK